VAKRRPRGRDLNGILLLDKSSGVSSNGALQMAKKNVCCR
jgi:tRNA pseudouridine55 synthase